MHIGNGDMLLNRRGLVIQVNIGLRWNWFLWDHNSILNTRLAQWQLECLSPRFSTTVAQGTTDCRRKRRQNR